MLGSYLWELVYFLGVFIYERFCYVGGGLGFIVLGIVVLVKGFFWLRKGVGILEGFLLKVF